MLLKARKKRFWIISELFYPDETSTAYILTCIARRLSSEYDVHVICGGARCSVAQTPDFKVSIHTCGKSTTSGRNLIMRAIRMIILTCRLVFAGFRFIRKHEPILIVTNPVPLMVGVTLLKKLKNSRMTLLVHDVFPENTLAAGIFPSDKAFLYRILRSVFDRAYCAADQLIVLGRDMAEIVRDKFGARPLSPIHVIENWADTDSIKVATCRSELSPDLNFSGKIVLQYAGNIGRVQGLFEVVECLYESRNDLLHLCIWGAGAALPELRDYVAAKHIQNVSFHGVYNRSQQSEVLDSCDLAVISLSKNMYGMGVPSKSYNIMAAGKPILFIGDPQSEIGLTVAEQQIGYVIPNDRDVMIAFFKQMNLSMMSGLSESGKRARQVAEDLYSREVILDKFMHILS